MAWIRELVSLSLSLALLTSAASASATGATIPPHILLVVADDLGYEDLGYKNGNKTLTPHIDGLVATGVRVENYYT